MNTIIKYEEMWVTPEIATDFLKSVPDFQRTLRKRDVLRYSKLMDMGVFSLMPGQIAFDTDGYLINGQHTLHAVVKHGKPVYLNVNKNCPKDCFRHFDQAIRRSMTDITRIDRRKLEVVNKMLDFVNRRSLARVPELVDSYYSTIESEVEMFFKVSKHANTARKGFNAPIRTGAVISIMTGNRVEYVAETYDKMYRDEVFDESLGSCPRSLWTRMISNNFQAKSKGGDDLRGVIVMAYKAFDEKRKDSGRLLATQRDIEFVEAVINTYFDAVRDDNNTGEPCEKI